MNFSELLIITIVLVVLLIVWYIITFDAYFPVYQRLIFDNPASSMPKIIINSLIVTILFVVGIAYFAVDMSDTVQMAFVNGALLGLIICGVYDFTLGIIYNDVTVAFTTVDILGGIIGCAVAAAVAKKLNN